MRHIQNTVNVGAAGTAATPTEIFGQYLTTHGIYFLSYAELFQILAATWILILIFKAARVMHFIKWIYDRLRDLT